MDWVDGCGAAEAVGGAFGEAEVARFAGVHGGGHGRDDGFDGDFAVEAVAWRGCVSVLEVEQGEGEARTNTRDRRGRSGVLRDSRRWL